MSHPRSMSSPKPWDHRLTTGSYAADKRGLALEPCQTRSKEDVLYTRN